MKPFVLCPQTLLSIWPSIALKSVAKRVTLLQALRTVLICFLGVSALPAGSFRIYMYYVQDRAKSRVDLHDKDPGGTVKQEKGNVSPNHEPTIALFAVKYFLLRSQNNNTKSPS